jgi:peptidoglycan hydrolase-like protein with peptidoglycan-binding domain
MTKNQKISKGFAFGVTALALAMVITPSISSALTLTRQLQVGKSGADVTALQTFLAQDRVIYPQGKVTGYFGFLTKSAVSNFQSRNNLTADGISGARTNAVINFQMSNGIGNANGLDLDAPIISSTGVNVTTNTANVAWYTNENATGVVYYSTSPIMLTEGEYSATVTGQTAMTDNFMHTSQNVALQGLQSNTTYYYAIYTTDSRGNVTITWPTTFRTN